MSKLTLEEAISHCLEVAEQNDAQAEKWREEGGEEWGKTTTCRECAADHRQLAEWLTEFKHLKAVIAGYGTVDMQNLDMILAMIRTESEGAWTRIEREKELAEAKRLLRLAMEDMNILYEAGKDEGCVGIKFKWRYADEALALIGDEPNGI